MSAVLIVLLGLLALLELGLLIRARGRASRKDYAAAVAERDGYKSQHDTKTRLLQTYEEDLDDLSQSLRGAQARNEELERKLDSTKFDLSEAMAVAVDRQREASKLKRSNEAQTETILAYQQGLKLSQAWRVSLDELITLLLVADRAKPTDQRRWTGVPLAPAVEWIVTRHSDLVDLDSRDAAEERIIELLDSYAQAL